MLLRHVVISCSDLSASSLFYIGVLELDCIDSSDNSLELSGGIVLMDENEYLLYIDSDKEERFNPHPITLEFEVPSFDKFLYKLYKNEFTIDYEIFIHQGRRALRLMDPDRNIVLVKEAYMKPLTASFDTEQMDSKMYYPSSTLNQFEKK